MRLPLPVRVLLSFRNPQWGLEWLAGFLGDRAFSHRHRRRVSEYDRYRVELSVAIARVTARPQAEVEELLAQAMPEHGSNTHSVGSASRWAGSPELAAVCYAVSRIMKPTVVVETGVGSGMSSLSFLTALHENNLGRLYSIDLPTPNSADLPSIGHLVPEGLKSQWVLTLGPSTKVLPTVLREVGPVDLFLHDSRHSYANQMQEYLLVWPHLQPGGLVISDDVSNDAFLEMAEQHGVEPIIVGQSKPHPIGMLRKSADR